MPASPIALKTPFQSRIWTRVGDSRQPVRPAGTVAYLTVPWFSPLRLSHRDRLNAVPNSTDVISNAQFSEASHFDNPCLSSKREWHTALTRVLTVSTLLLHNVNHHQLAPLNAVSKLISFLSPAIVMLYPLLIKTIMADSVSQSAKLSLKFWPNSLKPRAYLSVCYYTKCVLLKAGCAALKIDACNIKICMVPFRAFSMSVELKRRELKRFLWLERSLRVWAAKKVIKFWWQLNKRRRWLKRSSAFLGRTNGVDFLKLSRARV